jgi:hypothetical protein
MIKLNVVATVDPVGPFVGDEIRIRADGPRLLQIRTESTMTSEGGSE